MNHNWRFNKLCIKVPTFSSIKVLLSKLLQFTNSYVLPIFKLVGTNLATANKLQSRCSTPGWSGVYCISIKSSYLKEKVLFLQQTTHSTPCGHYFLCKWSYILCYSLTFNCIFFKHLLWLIWLLVSKLLSSRVLLYNKVHTLASSQKCDRAGYPTILSGNALQTSKAKSTSSVESRASSSNERIAAVSSRGCGENRWDSPGSKASWRMWNETDEGKTGHREIEGGGLSPPHTTTIWRNKKMFNFSGVAVASSN